MYSNIPFKSCSLFGSLRYLSNLKNVVCLIHGPSGCSFFNRGAMISLNGYYCSKQKVPIPKIYCTDFNENDTIFGGIEKLNKAVDEIVDKLSPEAIFILNCCVSEVIGENIDDVAANSSIKHGINIIPVHSAGFKGDHKY